jgi:hypothetical protein
MTDVEPLILDSLQRLVPSPGLAGMDWADVERRADGQPQRHRRFVLIAAGIAAILVVAGVALAETAGLPWWASAAPAVHPQVVNSNLAGVLRDSAFLRRQHHLGAVDLAHARTVATSGQLALVAAPIGTRGFCLIAFVPKPTLGTSCTYPGRKPPGNDFNDYRRPAFAGGALWILYGRITLPHAATLDLSRAAGVSFKISLGPGGFFLAQVPKSSWSALSGKTGPGQILSASGTTLEQGCISWGPSPAAVAPFLRPIPGISGSSPNQFNENLGYWNDQGTRPCRPQLAFRLPTLNLKSARVIVSTTLASDFSIWKKGSRIALWAMKKSDGTRCILVGPIPLVNNGPLPILSGQCQPRPTSRAFQGKTFLVGYSGVLAGGQWNTMIKGFVSPHTKAIVTLELRSPNGTISVPYKDGVFFVELPGGSPGSLPGRGPYTLVAYNAVRHVIARQQLRQPGQFP